MLTYSRSYVILILEEGDDLNERIKELRLKLNMTQEEFGKKIGVTRSAISYLESGRSKLTEKMLFLICITFDVRKEWLKNGTGSMFITLTVGEELAGYMGRLLVEEDPEKEKYALIVLKLLVDEWELIKSNMQKINELLVWASSKPEESELP